MTLARSKFLAAGGGKEFLAAARPLLPRQQRSGRRRRRFVDPHEICKMGGSPPSFPSSKRLRSHSHHPKVARVADTSERSRRRGTSGTAPTGLNRGGKKRKKVVAVGWLGQRRIFSLPNKESLAPEK